jgi:hypothetical protein
MIHHDRAELASRLAPDALFGLVMAAMSLGLMLLVKLSTGVGKTYWAKQYILSGIWRQRFTVIVLAFNTRDQMHEVALELRAEGVSVGVYPGIDEAPCMPNEAIAAIAKTGNEVYLNSVHCRHCHLRETCAYRNRMRPASYVDVDVIIIPEQLLGLDRTIVQRLSGDRIPQLILDEVISANGAYFVSLPMKCVMDDMHVARLVKKYEMFNFLLERLHKGERWDAVPHGEGQDLRSAYFSMSVVGPKIIPGYRCHIREACAFAEDPLWYDYDQYTFRRPPFLPPGTILLGAYLSPKLLAYLFDIPEPLNPFEGEIVIHPGTRIVNIRTTESAKSKQWRSRSRWSNLIADAYGKYQKSLVVLGSRGKADLTVPATVKAGLDAAFAERGKTVHVKHWQSPELCGDDIAWLTYGAAGSNRLKDREMLIIANSFYVKPSVVADIIFGHLPPDDRPQIHIDRQRHCSIPGFEQYNEIASLLLFRLEADVLLQAVGRVRQAVQPRLVVLSSWYDLEPHIGPVTTVSSVSEAREALGLEPTKTCLRDLRIQRAITLAASGMKKAEIAAAMAVSRSWLTNAFRQADIHLPRGRPPSPIKGQNRAIKEL